MPKRVIDFDAMWGSDKLAACADWAQAEYAWLYGLADASGCFEMTNLRVIWGRVAAVRGNFTIERLEQVFLEFQDKGLLFVWEHEGKRYAHWTGSDVPGRLPPPSWRMRLEKFAPPVPKPRLAGYMARFAQGRAVLGRSAFRGGSGADRAKEATAELQGNLTFENADLKFAERKTFGDSRREFSGAADRDENRRAGDSGAPAPAGKWREDCASSPACEIRLKGRVEGDQGQDLDLDLELNLDLKMDGELGLRRGGGIGRTENSEREYRTQDGKENRNSIPDQNYRSEQNTETYFKNSKASAGSSATRSENDFAKAPAKTNLPASENPNSNSTSNSNEKALTGFEANAFANLHAERTFCEGTEKHFAAAASGEANAQLDSRDGRPSRAANEAMGAAEYRLSAREIAVQKELRVGAGPVCGPVRIRPEVLERIRLREEAWARERAGKRAG